MTRDDPPGALATPSPGDSPFAKVVRDHWTSVYRFLYSTTANPHDAEDLTQETFLRAWNRFDKFQPGTSLKAWLLRIAANAACDVQRRRQRVSFSSIDHDPPGNSPDPGHGLEVSEETALLKVALEQLTEKTRMVFHLRVTEDLSFREIAAMVGTTEQAARQHMGEARSRLLKQLAPKP